VTDRERAAAFLLASYRRRADRVDRFPWGELVTTPSLPRIWDANLAVVSRWDGSAGELERELDAVQERAGLAHRKAVILDEELAARLWPAIERQGWEYAGRSLLMVLRRPPDRPPDPAVEVVAVDRGDWAAGRRALIELEAYGDDPEVVEQLLVLDERLGRGLEARYLAARAGGRLGAFAALYLGDGGVAQIEDVATLPAFRNRGLARAVVLGAAAQAGAAGVDLVFLVAEEDDWPHRLYGRLGFDTVGAEHVFGRSGRHHSHA
jgi:ribosomal protein S18 acetylase RimI-like enzyme